MFPRVPPATPPRLDLAGADDVPFLWEMLTYAATMTPGGAASVAEAQADLYLRTYVEGWGRAADLGVVARDDQGAQADRHHDHGVSGATRGPGTPIGAAWVRAGLLVAAEGAPELATAIVPTRRGQGVGAAMMNELFLRAAGRFDAIVLSVRATNPALRFYERLGFRREREVTNRVGGVSWVMRRPLG